MTTMLLQDDPRFREMLHHFRAGDFFEASEAIEDLFFEAVRDEVPFARLFLQWTVGLHHVERGQRRAAIERLAEALRVIEKIDDDRGFDLASARGEITEAIGCIERHEAISAPRVRLRV